MPNRLSLDDDSLFPIQAFFNAVGDSDFVHVVDLLAKGVGFTTNECSCDFPDDLDPGEELFDGVRFSIFKDSVVVSPDLLRYYITRASDAFIKQNPEAQDAIKRLIEGLWGVPVASGCF